jgi:hypothetical protein
MILKDALHAVTASVWGCQQRFRQPLYGSYSFHRLPATIARLLTNRTSQEQALPPAVWEHLAPPYEQVVLLFVDAFGWQFFQRFVDELPFLRRFAERGLLVPLTTQFPSTTAAHVTCVHLGQAVGQSGVYEWHYYEPIVDDVIGPLTFGIAGQKRESLKALGFSPAQILPAGPTFYQQLAAQDVQSLLYQSIAYAQSSYTQQVGQGATRVGFQDLYHALALLRQEVLRPLTMPRYHCLYLDGIDAACHLAGPNSTAFAGTVRRTFTALEEEFYQAVAGKAGKTLLLLTADHGQAPIDPATAIFLNEALPDLPRKLRTTRSGKPIRFGGSPRDLFLYVQDAHLEEVANRLTEFLGNRAEVWRTADLIAQGFFGIPSSRLLERLGNLVILPFEGEAVYWRDQDFTVVFQGHHGGLTPAEMETGAYFLEL